MKKYILATCPIPWDENFNFAEEVFRNHLVHIIENGTRYLYLFGTAGEGYAVSDGQFERITKVFCDEMERNHAEPMLGIISLSLETVIERIKLCLELGINSFQISLPAWGICTFDEIKRFFAETCGRFSDSSFLHYNCPRCKRMITPDEYAWLANKYTNLVATKNGASSPSDIISLTQKNPNLRHYLTEANFAVASLLGLDVHFLISCASSSWLRAKRFHQACVDHKAEDINKYLMELREINTFLHNIIGQQGHIDGVYDKIYSKIADDKFPLRLLPPYSYANDESFLRYVKYLKDNYPNWIDG